MAMQNPGNEETTSSTFPLFHMYSAVSCSFKVVIRKIRISLIYSYTAAPAVGRQFPLSYI